MGYDKRKACSKAKVDVAQFQQLKDNFLLEIKMIVSMDEIPPELVIKLDWIMFQHHTGAWIMKGSEGWKRSKGWQKAANCSFFRLYIWQFLPSQIIYEGKTDHFLPYYQFPSTWHVTKTEKHRANEQTIKKYFNKIILPYIQKKKKALKLSMSIQHY